jgi:hypothetical protein
MTKQTTTNAEAAPTVTTSITTKATTTNIERMLVNTEAHEAR